MTEQIPNFSMDKLPAVGGYFPSFCDDMVVNNSSPMGFNTFCEKSTDLPFFAVTVDVPADMPAGTYTVGIDLDNSKGHSKIAFDDGQSVPQQYEPVNYPMTIVVGDGGPVSKDTTTTTTTTVDKPVTTTTTTSAVTTPKADVTTANSVTPIRQTQDANGYEFYVDTVDAVPGQGSDLLKAATADDAMNMYDETDASKQFVVLPVRVNSYQPTAAFKTLIKLTDEEKNIFKQNTNDYAADAVLDHPYDDDPGAFVGSKAEYNRDEYYYVVATGDGQNVPAEGVSDGTAMFFYLFTVADEASVKSAASSMGLTLKTDAKGSYYEFPIEFGEDNLAANQEKQVADTNSVYYVPVKWTAGAIKVYVEADSDVTTTTTTTTTTSSVPVPGTTTTSNTTAPNIEFSITPVATTIQLGESFNITVDPSVAVTYNSTEVGVAAVDTNGKVTGVGLGNARIVVADTAGNTQMCEVTVVPGPDQTTTAATTPAPVVTTKISAPESVTMYVGDTVPFEINDPNAKMDSQNENVVFIDNNGNIVAASVGETDIISSNDSGTVKTHVTVLPRPDVTTTTGEGGSTVTTTVSTNAGNTTTAATTEKLTVTPTKLEITIGDSVKVGTGSDADIKVNKDGVTVDVSSSAAGVLVYDSVAGTITGLRATDDNGAMVVVSDGTTNVPVTIVVNAIAKTTVTTVTNAGDNTTTVSTTVSTAPVTTTKAATTTAKSATYKVKDAKWFFYSAESNWNNFTPEFTSADKGNASKVTYRYNGKTVAGPKNVFTKGTHKYVLDMMYNGTKVGTLTAFIGVKGDADLDDEAKAEDATVELIAYAQVLNGDKGSLGHSGDEETLAIFLADINGPVKYTASEVNIKNITSEDATATLIYYAYMMNDGAAKWKNCWSAAQVDF
jgi:hypothetical protein